MKMNQDSTWSNDTGSGALAQKLQAMTGDSLDRRVASGSTWGGTTKGGGGSSSNDNYGNSSGGGGGMGGMVGAGVVGGIMSELGIGGICSSAKSDEYDPTE